jgi:circadian clock protein KaiC
MAHSNQIREFLITARGIQLRDVHVGPGGVLTGSSRLSQQASERASALAAQQEIERQTRQLLRRRRALEAQVLALKTEFAAEEEELQRRIAEASARQEAIGRDQSAMALSRRDGNARARRSAPRPTRSGARKVTRAVT